MHLLRKESEPRRHRFFRPFYLLIIWGLLAGLLIVNGLLESQRTQKNLYQMLSDEGTTLITGLEKNAQNIFVSLAALENLPAATPLFVASPINFLELEDAVADLVLGVAFQVDRELGPGPLQEVDLSAILKDQHLSSAEVIPAADRTRVQGESPLEIPRKFYQPLLEGKAGFAIDRAEKNGTGQMGHLSVAVLRKAAKGILVLRAEGADLRFFRRRIILQGWADEWIGKGETKYISFQGRDGEIWADTDPGKIGKKEEESFADEIWRKGGPQAHTRYRREAGILEIAKVISLDRNTRALVRVGLSAERAQAIVAADRRNIILFSLLLLAFGGVGLTFIYRMENRHLEKIREMEDKIHQSEKLSSLANLAAGVAHEIRNPLNAIGMAIQRLQREFAPTSPEAQREYFQFTDVLRGEVGRVNDIIEQFLFFARPARLERRPVQIGDLLRQLTLLCSEKAKQQQVSIDEKIDPDLPVVPADPGRLEEALLNLINNGLQAMAGGGRLGIEAGLRDGQVLIQISDSGEGIPEENLGRIFDYYFTTKEKGTGLGLPLAHKIISEHGGLIEVQSRVGRGTTFRVSLPVKGGERE